MSEFKTRQLGRGFTFALTARISPAGNKKRRREKPQSTRLFFCLFVFFLYRFSKVEFDTFLYEFNK